MLYKDQVANVGTLAAPTLPGDVSVSQAWLDRHVRIIVREIERISPIPITIGKEEHTLSLKVLMIYVR